MLVIANFKQNLDLAQYINYVSEIENYFKTGLLDNADNLNIVFCPPNPYLYLFQKLTECPNVKIGAQDISKFNGGSNTGEVSASQIADFCDYVLLGHSERRSKLLEEYEDVNAKIDNSLKNNLTPVVCVRGIEDLANLPTLSNLHVAYEPVEKIGGTDALSAKELAEFYTNSGLSSSIIYGGSVNSKTVKDLLSLKFIEGFLVGGASLDPNSFIHILRKLL